MRLLAPALALALIGLVVPSSAIADNVLTGTPAQTAPPTTVTGQAAPAGTLTAHGAPAVPAAVLDNTPVAFDLEADRVEARDSSDRVVWSFDLRTGDTAAPRVLGPEPTEAGVWVAQRADVWLLDRGSGRVLVRHRLPGNVAALAVEGNAVRATCGDSEGPAWERTLLLSASEPTVGPQPMGVAAAIASRRRAEWMLERALSGQPDSTERGPALDEVSADELARVAAEMGAAEAFDATNPWIPLQSARVAQQRGDMAGARAAAGRALGVDDAYAMELLPIAVELDAIDPEMAERAFVRGLEAARAAGWDPQMATSLVTVMVWLGRPTPATELEPDAVLPAATRRAERVWQLAPNVESASVAYATLADRLEEATDLSGAAEWRARAAEARPWVLFGAPRTGGLGVGLLVSLLLALAGAAVLGTAIRLLRWAPGWWAAARSGTAATRIPTRAWPRTELIGTLLVLLAAGWVGLDAGREVAVVGRAASAPIAVGGGFPGHPAVAAFWSGIEGPEAAQMAAYAEAWASAPGSVPMPPVEVVARAWSGGMGFVDPLAAATMMSTIDPSEGNALMTTLAAQLPLLVVLVLVAAGLGGARVTAPARAGTPGWLGFVLSLLVPGTGRGFGPVGPFVTAASLLWLQAWQVWASSQGQAVWILDAIALPNMAAYWGLAEMRTTVHPLEVAFVQWGWGLWLVNLVVVTATEKLRPAHGGVLWR